MSDLISSGVIPVVRLTEVFQQAAQSHIIHHINQGCIPDLSPPRTDSDFYFVQADDAQTAVSRIIELVKTRITKWFSLDPIRDIQVLCPMNRGGVGARSLNLELQAALNPAGDRKVERFGWTFAGGDKVISSRRARRACSIRSIAQISGISTGDRRSSADAPRISTAIAPTRTSFSAPTCCMTIPRAISPIRNSRPALTSTMCRPAEAATPRGRVFSATPIIPRSPTRLPWPHIHGTPVFARFQNDAQFLFVWPEKDRLKRFTFNGTLFDPKPLESGAIAPPLPLPNGNHYPIFCPGPHPDRPCACPHGPQDLHPLCLNMTGTGMPGGMLAVNIDGDSGQGVLFAAIQRCAEDLDPGFQGHPCVDQRLGSLRAYDPFTLKEVWNDCGTGPSLPGDCNLGHTGTPDHTDDYYFAKFVPPTVAGGRVFLATASPPGIPGKVIVYGK